MKELAFPWANWLGVMNPPKVDEVLAKLTKELGVASVTKLVAFNLETVIENGNGNREEDERVRRAARARPRVCLPARSRARARRAPRCRWRCRSPPARRRCCPGAP